MARPPKELVESILRSLKERPKDWEIDDYSATNHGAGVEVWIGNELYGMEITVGDRNGRKTYGGVIIGSILVAWRWRLYLAAMKARKANHWIEPGSTATASVVALLDAAQ